MTKGKLVELLDVYPDDYNITTETGESIRTLINGDGFILMSTEMPTEVSKGGEYVFQLKQKVKGKFISPFESGKIIDEDNLKIKE